MSDWQPGDLALCVKPTPIEGKVVAWEPQVGAIYIVAEYREVDREGFLELEEDPEKFDPDGAAWEPLCFVKVTPPEADAFDQEIISLMNTQPTPQTEGV